MLSHISPDLQKTLAESPMPVFDREVCVGLPRLDLIIPYFRSKIWSKSEKIQYLMTKISIKWQIITEIHQFWLDRLACYQFYQLLIVIRSITILYLVELSYLHDFLVLTYKYLSNFESKNSRFCPIFTSFSIKIRVLSDPVLEAWHLFLRQNKHRWVC